MAQILYKAVDAAGKKRHGYIDAATLEEARAQLVEQGFSEPRFFTEPAAAVLRTDQEDLAAQSPAEQARSADFELRILEQPGFSTFIRELLRRNRIWLLINLAFLGWGLWQGDALLWGLALLSLGPMLLWPLWRFRQLQRYQRMLRAYALGDWSQTLALLEQLNGSGKAPLLMRSDYALREAYVRIKTKQSRLEREADKLEALRYELDAASPGIFDARYASLCAAAGDAAGVVAAMRQALAKSPEDSSRIVDLANTEARFGSVDQAEAVLEKLGDKVLQEMAQPFIDWTRGLIALRRNQPEAEAFLEDAMRGFMVMGANPAVLGAMGLCGGAYAIALARKGRHTHARDVVRKVSPVLKAHGDAALMTLLRFEMKKSQSAEAAAQSAGGAS